MEGVDCEMDADLEGVAELDEGGEVGVLGIEHWVSCDLFEQFGGGYVGFDDSEKGQNICEAANRIKFFGRHFLYFADNLFLLVVNFLLKPPPHDPQQLHSRFHMFLYFINNHFNMLFQSLLIPHSFSLKSPINLLNSDYFSLKTIEFD